MATMKTTYMGIGLKNPIIIGANNLVTDPKNAKALEDAGAAAIVYKSLFEEQIQLESYEMYMQMEAYNERNAEMTKLFPDLDHAGFFFQAEDGIRDWSVTGVQTCALPI